MPLNSKKKAAGVLVGLLAFFGLTAITLPAFAAGPNATGPRIKLTAIDTDIVAASGRDFAANADLTITATSTELSGNGTVHTGADGRFLVAFKLPAGFDDKLSVVTKTPNVKAEVNIEVPDEVKSTTSTSTSTSTTSTTTPTTSSTTSSTTSTTAKPVTGGSIPTLDSKLLSLSGATAFNTQADAYNKATTAYNTKVTAMNAKLATATADQKAAITADVNAINTKIVTLNAGTSAVNTSIIDINAKAKAATTQGQLDALEPQLATLTSQLKANTDMVNSLIASVDSAMAKLHG